MTQRDDYYQRIDELQQMRREWKLQRQRRRERQQEKWWRRFTGWCISPRGIAAFLGVIGVVILLAGHLYYYADWWPEWLYLAAGWEKTFEALWANVGTTLVGAMLVVYTVEWASERRADGLLKAQLIREMGSSDNGIALRAVRELGAREWLYDGSLRAAYLFKANLQEAAADDADLQGVDLSAAKLHEANLRRAKLQGADLVIANLQGANLENTGLQGAILWNANLQGAWMWGARLEGAELSGVDLQGAEGLTDEQLARAHSLRYATMADGSHYDGRFNLRGDIEAATRRNINPDDPRAMARFYETRFERLPERPARE